MLWSGFRGGSFLGLGLGLRLGLGFGVRIRVRFWVRIRVMVRVMVSVSFLSRPIPESIPECAEYILVKLRSAVLKLKLML